VLSGRGLCVEKITRPEESMRLCVWSRNVVNEEALAHWGGSVAPKTKQTLQLIVSLLIVDNIQLNLSRILTKNNSCLW